MDDKPKPTSKKKPVLKRKTARLPKISSEQRDLLFKYFCDKPTVNYVCDKSGISERTVRRYRKLDEWDKRWDKIKLDAERRVDRQTTKVMAEHFKIVQSMRQILHANFVVLGTKKKTGKDGQPVLDEHGKPMLSVCDLESPSKLARALIETLKHERVMHGEVSDRQEIVGELAKKIDDVMERGGPAADKLRGLLSQIADAIEPDAEDIDL